MPEKKEKKFGGLFCPFQRVVVDGKAVGQVCSDRCALWVPGFNKCVFRSIGLNLGNLAQRER